MKCAEYARVAQQNTEYKPERMVKLKTKLSFILIQKVIKVFLTSLI